MSAICLVDTSVFVEILRVPGMDNHYADVVAELEARLTRLESLFLPMATILETGNHIGQHGDGRERRACAQRFVQQVGAALNGQSPFKPINFLEAKQLQAWLAEFPDHAGRGSGLGDLSIIHDWQRLCEQNPQRRVTIWSLDQHLAGYDRPAP